MAASMPYSVEGFRKAARRSLPRPIFDFVDGGAETEWSCQESTRAFRDYAFRPAVLRGQAPNLATSVAGVLLDLPIMLSPVGSTGLVHPAGETAAVLAANSSGTIGICPSFSSYGMEEIAERADVGRAWYQVLPLVDREELGAVLARAAATGFSGLCVTVDVPAVGKRERDLRNGLSMPPRLTALNAVQLIARPRWLWGALSERRVVVSHGGPAGRSQPKLRSLFARTANSAADLHRRLPASATWEDFAWIREHWSGPIAIKGVLRAEDAVRAVDMGAEVVIVSNHGGRQLDGAEAPIRALGPIVQAVGGRADIVLDGGIRRGTDVVKALCLGAAACSIGRPWVYGLAAGGVQGVNAVLEILRDELNRAMLFLGQGSVRDLSPSLLDAASPGPHATPPSSDRTQSESSGDRMWGLV